MKLEMEGNFRALVTDFGLDEKESGAVAVNLRFEIMEMYSQAEGKTGSDDPWYWYQAKDAGLENAEVYGQFWIIGKGEEKKGSDGSTTREPGKVNDRTVQDLVKHLNWDGDIMSIVERSWKPNPMGCQITVRNDPYKNENRYRAEFIAGWDDPVRRGMKNIDSSRAAELKARYGGSLRAIASNVKRNAGGPAPVAAAPRPARATPPKSTTQELAMAATGVNEEVDDIPF